jgi:hypothetical protein
MRCLARLIRCAIVASGTRKARAISAVVSPPTARSVSGIAEAGVRAGWQHRNSRISESSRSGTGVELLASDFTVYTYDRRGRGERGDTQPYEVAREVEDLEAVISEAGGGGVRVRRPSARHLRSRLRRAVWRSPNWRCTSHRSTLTLETSSKTASTQSGSTNSPPPGGEAKLSNGSLRTQAVQRRRYAGITQLAGVRGSRADAGL